MEASDDPYGIRPRRLCAHAARARRRDRACARLCSLRALANRPADGLPAQPRRPRGPNRTQPSAGAVMQTAEEVITPEAPPSVRARPWSVLSSSAFRKLWFATILSLFGDFFSYVAMA